MAPTLERLPPTVIRCIIDCEPDLLPLLLYGLGSRSVFQATREALYETVALVDWDGTSSQDPKAVVVFSDPSYARCVRRLTVQAPGWTPRPDAEPLVPLNDRWLLGLVDRLPNVQSFAWESDRLPPVELCTVLGVSALHLQSFTLDVAEPCESRASAIGRRQRSTSIALSSSYSSSEDDEAIVDRSTPQRWDAPHLSSLAPSTLKRLSLSSLSATGARVLGAALQGTIWDALRDLELSRTLFVDDKLMANLAKGARRLERLCVREMHGTKLSEAGVAALTEGLMHLKTLEFIDVEGRLSKDSWLKFDGLPSSLRTLRFAYREDRSPHSWTLDHLGNIISVLSLPPRNIRTLSIARIVPEAAKVPGRHNKYPGLAICPRLAIKRLTQEQLDTIVQDGRSLRELDIDFWLVSLGDLEIIVRKCPDLRKLKIMLDAPIQRLIVSTAFSLSKLNTLVISIPPEHTPQLADFGSPGNTPVFELKALPSPTSAIPPSPSPQAAPTTGSLTYPSPLHVRDLRKFLKKASHLHEIVWSGRGGLGVWKFERGGGLHVKVDFTPIAALLAPSAFTYGQHAGSLTQSVLPSTGSNPASPIQRRFSGYSPSIFANTSSLPTQPSPVSVKRRSQSIAGSSMHGTEPSTGRSRRSSAASTSATSWMSMAPSYANGLGLDGIPGTPTGDDDDVQGQMRQDIGGDVAAHFEAKKAEIASPGTSPTKGSWTGAEKMGGTRKSNGKV